MDRTIDTGTDDLLARVERGVGVVVLNRPERRNALSADMVAALAAVLADLEVADDVGSVLLTGAGGAFCAGGDVKGFAARGGEGGGTTVPQEERAQRQQRLQRATTGRLHAMGKPTVAALPGAAAGAGLGLALGCDLRIGCPATVIATAFGKVGLSGDYGTAWLLSRLVGPSRARRLMFLGERLDGQAAHELGLLDWMVDTDELDAFALSIAAGLAAGPRQALAGMKANLLDAQRYGLDDAMDREVPRHLECGVSEDHKEAVQAFVEKRPPVFGARTTGDA
ncbi:enoyl-CoA hydratase-related protein [Pseudonocardia nigra]|uniref:enoyl-CoA hydratase-related protein n=1 Tax=Pseudonocardia nigra TaxID=1921578 RepID=UPI001C604DE4|nr:enoyl-CoA hydratase-related protein [Pseudonocardia nigra]